MVHRRVSIALVLALASMVAVLLAWLTVTVAHASCAEEHEDAIASKRTVFVATAVEQRYRYARVEVEEVWRGPDLAPSVWFETTPIEAPRWPLSLVARSSSSSDAQLVPGTVYLIAIEDGEFRTNSCLVAQVSAPLVDRLAPETPREPVASGLRGSEPRSLDGTAGMALAVALSGSLTVGTWLAYRRMRTQPFDLS